MGLLNRSHPLRAGLAAGMHLRRLPRIAAPCRLVQVLTLIDEASAEAASTPDRVVHLTAVAYRRFRIEVMEPLLNVPKMKGTGKKKKPPQNGERPPMPKGRLARSVKELLESEGEDEEEKRRLAGGLAFTLRACGIKVDQPLRKKLDRYMTAPEETDSPDTTG